MGWKIWILSWMVALGCLAGELGVAAQSQSQGESQEPAQDHYQPLNEGWLRVEIGIIGSASADILANSIAEVRDKGYSGLLIVLDTPGGALEATRAMVKQILATPFPIAVWVGPSGARAGSAGAFITLAAHVAAMAPGTNIGAAHPVQATGQDIEDSEMKKKIENDTVAFMESIAKVRGRNEQMAISFVVNSLSVTADEALKENVIDMVVGSPDEMLRQMNGLSVTINDQKQQLDTSDAQIFVYEKSLREQFLEIISNPNLFYLLFIVGIIGLGIELTNPGALIPGVLGGIALIMALIATSVLPVNFGAMLLILISVAFMVAEVFIPSFGILGIGGFVAFLIGSVLLIDSSDELGLTISWWTIVPGALGVAAFGGLVSYLVMKTERTQVHSGVEGLKGHRALAIESFGNGRGRVRMDGEYWNARLADGVQRQIEEGEELNVVAVDGLTLIVEPRSAV